MHVRRHVFARVSRAVQPSLLFLDLTRNGLSACSRFKLWLFKIVVM